MPPFNFGQTFNQSLQSSLSRAQQRRASRASRQLRLQRLNQRARRWKRQRELERMKTILGQRADRRERRRTTVEVPTSIVPAAEGDGTVRVAPEVAAELEEKSQPEPQQTIEVRRQNIPSLPGTGPANVDPDTLIRHGRRDEANGQGNAADSTGDESGSGGGTKPTSGTSFDTSGDARTAYQSAAVQEQKALDAGVSKDSLASIQDRLSAARMALDSMATDDPDFFELRQQAYDDTTQANTLQADTTGAADTSTVRGRGNSGLPDVDRPDASGGGGGFSPTSGSTRLRDMGGQPRGMDLLTQEAKSLVIDHGPQEVRRRLDSLMATGRIDRATRDSVHARALSELARVRQQMGQ
jgi:hypothetical protein